MLKIIHFVQNLSLDITIGAVIMTLFIGEVFGVALSYPMLTGLAIAIWLIYTVDHLLDARKAKMIPSNPRHAFHQRYFKSMVGFAMIVFAIGLWNLGNLPQSTLIFGFFLAATSGVYLLYSYFSQKPFRKELFAAFVYTAGISTPPLGMMDTLEWYQLLFLLQLFTLVYANLLIIPLFEHDIDVEDHHTSVATLKGASTVKQRVLLICSLNTFMIILQLYSPFSLSIHLILGLMTFVLFTLVNKQSFFRKYQLFRILADGIFFLPAIYFLL